MHSIPIEAPPQQEVATARADIEMQNPDMLTQILSEMRAPGAVLNALALRVEQIEKGKQVLLDPTPIPTIFPFSPPPFCRFPFKTGSLQVQPQSRINPPAIAEMVPLGLQGPQGPQASRSEVRPTLVSSKTRAPPQIPPTSSRPKATPKNTSPATNYASVVAKAANTPQPQPKAKPKHCTGQEASADAGRKFAVRFDSTPIIKPTEEAMLNACVRVCTENCLNLGDGCLLFAKWGNKNVLRLTFTPNTPVLAINNLIPALMSHL
ncbi:hypothetical protein RSOL_247660, partial [Rhizoctonia solani AG-3 Rhs1AP]